jgi:Flp pilus assembly protein CpaB
VARRSIFVLVAAALGVLASAGAYTELHSVQQRDVRNSKLASVYVLTSRVPKNDSAAAAYTQGLLKRTRMPLQFVPVDAVTNLSLIGNRVAEFNLPAGEILTDQMFGSPTALGSVAAQTVPPGDVAVSVTVGQAQSVGGLIAPGDKVDILVELNGDQESYLYQSVPVLAVGTSLVPAPGKAPTPATAPRQEQNVITFAVRRSVASRIALAGGSHGGVTNGVYLALQSAAKSAFSATSITDANLIPGNPTGVVAPNPTPLGSTGIPSTNPIPGRSTIVSGGTRTVPARPKSGSTNEPTP